MFRGEVKGSGFILRLVRAQDADVIVKILTSKGERLSCFAKAGLKSRKRFGGALEGLNYVQYRGTFKSQEQDLCYLEEAQVKADFKNLKGDLDRLVVATYVAEIAEYSIHEGLENTEIFNLFGATLKVLDSKKENGEGIARQFEIKLLSILGWLPEFDKCEACGNTGGLTGDLTLNPETGHVTCRDCGVYTVTVGPEARLAIKQCLETSILKGGVDEVHSKRLEKVSSALLKAHWGNRLLKSTRFLSSLRSGLSRFQE